jgi:hypothetical protein
LAALEAEFAEEIAVVTICLGASTQEVRATLAEVEADVLALVDEDWETVDGYRVGGTPTTYLIDETGAVFSSHVGYGDGTEASLRTDIERLLEE